MRIFIMLFGCIALIRGDLRTQQDDIEPVETDPGVTVNLSCITDSKDSVNWRYLDHDVLIGTYNNNSTKLFADSTIYQLTATDNTALPETKVFTLQFVNSESTFGTYQCQSNINVRYSVSLNGFTHNPVHHAVESEKCCRENKVPEKCLLVCDPSRRDLRNFSLSTTCPASVPSISKCNQGDRNTARCCSLRGMRPECLDLCIDRHFNIRLLKSCGEYRDVLALCFGESSARVPSPPKRISGVIQIDNDSTVSILVTWSAPEEAHDYVTGYNVFYRRVDSSSSHFYSIYKEGKGASSVLINSNVEPDADYQVYVQALSTYGSSFNSEKLVISTFTQAKFHNGTNVPECCEKAGVPMICVDPLCGGTIGPFMNATTLHLCGQYLSKVVLCYADKRNHMTCCKNSALGIPTDCRHLCEGDVSANHGTSSDLHCLKSLPSIAQCINEGNNKVPSPPKNLVAVDITASSIVLSWSAPDHMPEDTEFIVYVNEKEAMRISSKATPYQVTVKNLVSMSIYNIFVGASTSSGSSLPSNKLVVITHRSDFHTADPGTTSKTVDAAACCRTANVDPSCQKYCSGEKNFDVDKCSPDAHKIMLCLSDYRNHEPCCKGVANLPSDCLAYCTLKPDDPAPKNPQNCMGHFESIETCYRIGHGTVASPPQEVRVSMYTSHSAIITWKEPNSRPVPLSSYELKVFYVANGELAQNRIIPANELAYSVDSLSSSTSYKIYLRAFTMNDSVWSLPSTEVILTTLPKLPDNFDEKNTKHYHEGNATKCCVSANVISDCLPLCNFESNINNTSTFASCVGSLPAITRCVSNSQNHAPCCLANKVNNICLSSCTAQADLSVFTNSICHQDMIKVFRCFQDGFESLPLAPKIREFAALNSHTIEISVDMTNVRNGTNLLVFYKVKGASKTEFIEKPYNAQGIFTLKPLLSETWYEAYFVFQNVNGSSLVSPTYSAYTLTPTAFPIFITAKPSSKVNEGSPFKLICSSDVAVENSPRTYTWYRNGELLEETASILNRANAKAADSGQYSCTIHWTSTSKFATASRKVIVQSKLYGNAAEAAIYVPLFQPVTLQCLFNGYPNKISWYNPQMIPYDNSNLVDITLDYVGSVTKSTMKIFKLYDFMYGDYSCKATNDVSSSTVHILVYNSTTDNIPPTQSPIDSNNQEDYKPIALRYKDSDMSSISIEWLPPRVGIANLNKYTIKVFNLKDMKDVLQSIDYDKSKTDYTIRSLIESSTYSISVEAHYDNKQATSEILTASTKGPPQAPVHLHFMKGQSETTLLLTWENPATSRVIPSSYIITYKLGDKQYQQTSNTTQSILKCLKPRTTYKVTVVAVNKYGRSSPSEGIDVQTIKYDSTCDYDSVNLAGGEEKQRNVAGQVILSLLIVVILIFLLIFCLLYYWSQKGFPSKLRRCPCLYNCLQKMARPLSGDNGQYAARYTPHTVTDFDNPITFETSGNNGRRTLHEEFETRARSHAKHYTGTVSDVHLQPVDDASSRVNANSDYSDVYS